MRKKRKDLMLEAELADEVLEIPEDEIWTYQIEGLQAPRIVDKSVKLKTKVIIILVIIVAISLSVFFSIRAVSNTEFDYAPAEGGYEFVKYSNPGSVTEVTVDYVNGEADKPITEIHEYAFNCDEKIVTINVGKDVKKIDGKSFYSCWSLENVFVDDANPYYCDIDGVLYNKELTEVIYYPSAHNLYLTREAGYSVTLPENGSITNDDFCSAVSLIASCIAEGKSPADLTGDDASFIEKFDKLTGVKDYGKFIADYNLKAGVYVLPSTVTSVGKLAFAYADITEIYLPEGLKSIGTLGFFKAEKLREIYSYSAGGSPEVTDGSAVASLSGVCPSLPDSLEFIGSDAFTNDRGLTYMFIPSTVKEIGHHAFYGTAFKSGGVIEGIPRLDIQADEEAFRSGTKTGATWIPKVNAGLFEKNIEVVYSAQRAETVIK